MKRALYQLSYIGINMVGGEGFEPTHPRERIYSPPQLSNSAAYPITLFREYDYHKPDALHTREEYGPKQQHNDAGDGTLDEVQE